MPLRTKEIGIAFAVRVQQPLLFGVCDLVGFEPRGESAAEAVVEQRGFEANLRAPDRRAGALGLQAQGSDHPGPEVRPVGDRELEPGVTPAPPFHHDETLLDFNQCRAGAVHGRVDRSLG